jgi:hypothetical protein
MCSIHEVENHLQLHNLGYTIGAQSSLMHGTHTDATQIRSSFPLKTSKMIYHAPNPNIMQPGPFFLCYPDSWRDKGALSIHTGCQSPVRYINYALCQLYGLLCLLCWDVMGISLFLQSSQSANICWLSAPIWGYS